MRRIVVLVFLLALLFPVRAAAWPARVVYVSDGDTVHVEPAQGGARVKIRLYGIDCPESKQPYGQSATVFVSDLILFKVVDIEEQDIDRYGRTVALLHIGDATVQDALLETGLAWVYTRYCKRSECEKWKEKEKAAAKARQGLWSELDGPNKPVAPWDWRKKP